MPFTPIPCSFHPGRSGYKPDFSVSILRQSSILSMDRIDNTQPFHSVLKTVSLVNKCIKVLIANHRHVQFHQLGARSYNSAGAYHRDMHGNPKVSSHSHCMHDRPYGKPIRYMMNLTSCGKELYLAKGAWLFSMLCSLAVDHLHILGPCQFAVRSVTVY